LHSCRNRRRLYASISASISGIDSRRAEDNSAGGSEHIASDKDIEIAMAAFPTETTSPENIARFLRGMAKLQAYESAVNGAQAEWIQQNGTLGTSAEAMAVSGKTVAKGTRFQDFVAQFIPNTSVLETGAAPSAYEEVDY